MRVSEARAALCARTLRAEMARRAADLDQTRLGRLVVSAGYGASRPLPGFDVGNHVENRRVEVFLRAAAALPRSAWG